MKYPGAFILSEVGTNKELSKIYGVSERTIYRWKNKAKAETGERKTRPRRPRAKTLETFKGTRKELAKKYGVSERTAYRWLQKAKENGLNIPSRQKPSQYPGAGILDENAKNKELAEKYNVSERTIKRWKRRARTEIEEPFEVKPLFGEQGNFEDLIKNGVSDIFKTTESNFFEENFNFEEPEDMFEVPEPIEFSESFKDTLDNIIGILNDRDLLVKDSIFNNLSDEMKQIYINEYILYQWDLNPYQFNQSPPDDPNGPDLSDPDKISNIDIWGAEFETWLKNQIEIDKT